MNKEEKLDDPIEIELKGIGKKSFKSINSIIEWATKEKKEWGELRGIMMKNPLIKNYDPFAELLSIVEPILNHANGYLKLTDQNQRNNYLNTIKSFMGKPEYLSCDSPEAQQVFSLATTNPSGAWATLLKARGAKILDQHIINYIDFINAMISANNEGLDASKAIENQKKALENLRTEWEKILHDRDSNFEKLLNRNKTHARAIKKGAISRLKAYRDQCKDHESRMKKLEKEFSTEMKLKASEKYWSKKRKLNEKRAKTAFCKLCWSMVLGGGALIAIFFGLYKLFGTPKGLNVIHSLTYLTTTIIYFWLIRIFANEYRINRFLTDDAEERVAMVYTFKALEHDEKVSDEERLIILNALFRPHEKSVEENVPLPIWEALIKKTKG